MPCLPSAVLWSAGSSLRALRSVSGRTGSPVHRQTATVKVLPRFSHMPHNPLRSHCLKSVPKIKYQKRNGCLHKSAGCHDNSHIFFPLLIIFIKLLNSCHIFFMWLCPFLFVISALYQEHFGVSAIFCINSSWVPSSVIFPLSRNKIWSQNRVDARRCEINSAVFQSAFHCISHTSHFCDRI